MVGGAGVCLVYWRLLANGYNMYDIIRENFHTYDSPIFPSIALARPDSSVKLLLPPFIYSKLFPVSALPRYL